MQFLSSRWIIFLMMVLAGSCVVAQVSDLDPDRIMLFNDYPAGLRPKMDPKQSYYSTNWVHTGPAPAAGLGEAARAPLLVGTNHIFKVTTADGRQDKWQIWSCRTGSPHLLRGARSIAPINGYNPVILTNWMALLQNIPDARIETPYYTEGVGTIYFDALNVSSNAPNWIVVDIATNMFDCHNAYYSYVTNDVTGEVATNAHYAVTDFLLETETEQYSNQWQEVSNFFVDMPDSNPYRYQKVFNFRRPVRFRIKRGDVSTPFIGADDKFLAIDNICISRPPSDVVMQHPEVITNPGYPVFNSSFKIRCEASNIGTNDYEKTFANGDVNTQARNLKLYYRWRYLDQASNNWSTAVNMAYEPNSGDGQGNGEIWSVDIPAQARVGDLEYYIAAEFKGYRHKPFDYTKLGYLYWTNSFENSETLSPRSFRGDTSTGGREFYVRLRPYPSDFENVYVVTGPPWTEENPFPMTLISNNLWRGMVPVNGTMTNIHFYFRGDRQYDYGTKSIKLSPVFWSEAAQAMEGVVPFGGQCVELAARPLPPSLDKPIRVIAEGGGFMQVIFDLNTMKYMTTRAEYQDFNTWAAPTANFTDSNGQASKERFPTTFNAWPPNGATENKDFFKEYFVGFPANTNQFNTLPFPTLNGWQAGGAAFISERVTADTANKPDGIGDLYRNVSLRLKGGATGVGLGYVHNTRTTLPDGVDRLSFKARVAQKSLPHEAIYYKFGFTNQNYMVTANIRAFDTLSPEAPSISILGYYDSFSTFYELRLVQDVDVPIANPTRDKRVHFYLYKWRDGVAYQLGDKLHDADLNLFGGFTVELRISHNISSTTIKCRVGSIDNIISVTDSGAIGGASLKYGTCGFMSGECRAAILSVKTQPTLPDASPTGSATDILADVDIANLVDPNAAPALKKWSLAPAGRWKADAGVDPRGIYAITPVQKIGVFLQPTKHGTTSEVEPQAPGTMAWQLYKEISLTNFGYSAHTVDIKNWRSQFVMLQVIGRDDTQVVDIGVDELYVSSWRGQDASDLSSGENDVNNQIRNSEWAATESWITATNVAGLSEGRVPGNFNTTQRSPMSAVHLNTRLANSYEGWITNSTYVYNGQINLSGSTVFAANFNGRLQLTIGGNVILTSGTNSVATVTNSLSLSGWYDFDLRLGFDTDGRGGPLAANRLNGFGIAYSVDGGNSWREIKDTGTMERLRTADKIVRMDMTQEGRKITGEQPPYTVGNWLNQSVRGPLLERGVGLMEFYYKVVKAPAKISVQFAPEWDSTSWTTIQSWVVSNAMANFTHELAYLGTNISGYLRVYNDRSNNYTNAIVEFNNATVWDDPAIDDQSWRAYNVKVTDTDKLRIMMDGGKACYLNNSQTAETDPTQILYPEAHIISPMLPTGIGNLSFMARVYDVDQPGPLRLFVTTSAAGPRAQSNEWIQVANYTITNKFFETFNYKPNDGREYRAFKLITPTNGGGKRIGLENIAVAEPVLPGFEIAAVFPMCVDGNEYNLGRQQPLHNDIVGVQAQISNIRENPLDIKMYVSYYVGTNQWGYANWPANETMTLPMDIFDANSLTYRTGYPTPRNPLTDSIPVQEKNSVVQYCVWATYKDDRGILFTNRQKRVTFTNPSWYFPTDLNAKYGDLNRWSPYYIVYDVPVGAIWINEINAVDSAVDYNRYVGENKFVEIAVPAGYDLAGWRIDLVRNDYVVRPITLPEGMPPQENCTNGYAFFVIGENEMNLDNTIPRLPKQDFPNGGYLGLNDWLPQMSPGGLRLRRPMGMYEHVVAYDWMPNWIGFSGQTWANDDPQQRFKYIGKENNGGSLSVITNSVNYAVPSPSDWREVHPWTPGAPNLGQYVPDANLMAPGVSNVIVSSTLNILKGTQNGQRLTPLTFRIKIGSATNIMFVADAWYRLASIKVDGVEKLSGEASSFDLALSNIQSNTTVTTRIALRSEVGDMELPGDVLSWLMSFGDAPLAPTWYGTNPYQPLSDRRELSLLERFWINANPTRTNYLKGGVVGFVKEPTTSNFFVTVAVDLNGSNITHLLGDGAVRDGVFKIEARQPPAVTEWQFMKQFKFDASSFDANHRSTAYIFNPYSTLIPEADPDKPIALRWVIEYVHPLFSTTLLRSTNAPPLP